MPRPLTSRRLRSALAGTLACAAPIAAQAPPSDDIVVSGRQAPTSAAVARQVRAVTRADNFRYEPLARFQDKVCPGVGGLPLAVASAVVARVREVAAAAGVPLAREEGCTPNFLVIAVDDGRRRLRELSTRAPQLFEGVTAADSRALLADPGPVHAWVSVAVRGRHGEIIDTATGRGLQDPPTIRMPAAHSKIYLATRRDIVSAVILVDAAALRGVSAVQLADYAAMRGLARTRPAQGEGAPATILGLFDPAGAAPAELTAFDRAYLKGLYATLPNQPAAAQLGTVEREVRAAAAAAAP